MSFVKWNHVASSFIDEGKDIRVVYDPERYHRRSIRLKDYDYSQPGAYFVTLCTQNGTTVFGDILNGEMRLNDRGEIVQELWNMLPERFPTLELDCYVIMPNHMHGILVQGEQAKSRPIHTSEVDGSKHALVQPSYTELGQIIRTFKAIATRLIRACDSSEFAWHRNYYEHVIRNGSDLNRIRQYIVDNPARWTEDELYRGPASEGVMRFNK